MKEQQTKETGGVPAVRDVQTALATFAPVEGYSADDVRGKEGIDSSMLRLPFLSAAQKTSKAIDTSDDAYIEGLKFGDLYDPELGEIYGRGPIAFQALRLRKRAYLPDENGRMGEEIPWDDPRCEWPSEEEKAEGREKPEGVRVIDAVILIENELFPKVLSFKSKSFKAGQNLATFVSMVQGPAFTARFKLSTKLTENDRGKFAVLDVKAGGKPSPEQLKVAEALYESIKDKKITTAEDTERDEAAASGTGRTASASTANVPF